MFGFKKQPPMQQSISESMVEGETVLWGNVEIPESESLGHFLAVGATGSGKTTFLKRLMQSALPEIRTGSDRRALIYDAKQDVIPLLRSIAPESRIVTTHPFDVRGAAWELWRDVREPTVAIEIAFTLIPPTHESQPFFSDASRHLIYGVMLSFILTGKPWTFATLIRALKRPKRIMSILKRHTYTREIIGSYFYDDKLVMNIMSTLATKLLPYEPIAAAWESATERFSLEDWKQEDWILVLANYETGRTAIDAINRCIFKRASDLVLNQEESSTRRTWFILDELSEAGKLDGLVSLMKKGRSKGACVVLAFQSVSGLRDPKLYGPHFTDEILGQVANRFIGRLECVTTAEWASTIFGDQEVMTQSETQTSAPGGNSRSVSQQPQIRRMVLPGELMSIPACNKTNGLSGYHIVRFLGVYFDTVPGDEIFSHTSPSAVQIERGFLPRPAEAQLLQPWSKDEESIFGSRRIERSRHTRSPTAVPEAKHEEPNPSASLNDLDSMFE